MEPRDQGTVDWSAIARSDRFRELETARRRFLTVALSVFTLAVGSFLICCGYARDFMGSSVSGALTVAYTWLLALTVLAWLIAYLYLRFSARTLVPLAEEIARDAEAESGRRTMNPMLAAAAEHPARGLSHILMRFLTVPDAKAARSSVGWALGLIGVFYLFVAVIGLGSRAILGSAGEELAGEGGNLAAPYLAQELGGGQGSTGGDVFFSAITAVASPRSSPWSRAWSWPHRAPWHTTCTPR